MQNKRSLCLVASVVTGMSQAGLVQAGPVDALSDATRAAHFSLYETALEASPSSAERLTLARQSAIKEAFDAYLAEQPSVDSLSADRLSMMRRSYGRDRTTRDDIALDAVNATFLRAD
jgi:hypothetical protein